MKFFVPGFEDDPEGAEVRWSRLRDTVGAPQDSRRVYSATFMHDGSRIELTVGKPRKEFRRKTGPRGGYIKNAGQERIPITTGRVVVMIDTGSTIWAFCEPPFGGWANPSMVGRDTSYPLEYFENS